MALSRLRNPVISRGVSIARARFLSSTAPSRFLSRSSNGRASPTVDRKVSRSSSFPISTGACDNLLKHKLQIGVRFFSAG
ncbi:hypothetical protein CRG98_015910, partial [Punica granatum]